MKKRIYSFIMSLLLLGVVSGCSHYLDALPDQHLAVPESLDDLQALLDGYRVMNASCSALTEVLSDNYFVTKSQWQAISNATLRNYYTWQSDENTISEWAPYTNQIRNANVVLDELADIDDKSKTLLANQVKGTALFYRAFYHFSIAQLFSLPYDSQTAVSDLGIPIRVTSNFNEPAFRESVKGTYDAIRSDLVLAASLLPETDGLKTRPTKAAAFGMLARVSMAMLAYQDAGEYARQCLEAYKAGGLIDFNSLDSLSGIPFKQFNQEVIFQCVSNSNTLLSNSRMKADTAFYSEYLENDLRRTLYYYKKNDGYAYFKGDYDGKGASTSTAFTGLTLSEQYLIAAEASARFGDLEEATEIMNDLLQYRYQKESFKMPSETTQAAMLDLILNERRKELVMRGTRWLDLRRFSKEPGREIGIKRNFGNEIYSLLPGSLRYALKFPTSVIQNSQMQQNP